MSAQKPGLHPRNRHQHRYDLAALCQTTPELTSFLIRTPAGEQSVDFANPQAVKALNKALLAHFMPSHTGTFRQGFYVRQCLVVRIISIIWRICLAKRQGVFRRRQLFWT